jgi:hypothetical protein
MIPLAISYLLLSLSFLACFYYSMNGFIKDKNQLSISVISWCFVSGCTTLFLIMPMTMGFGMNMFGSTLGLSCILSSLASCINKFT